MTAKRDSKLFKQLLRELPYNGINIVYAHGQFNNSLPSQIPSKKYLERLTSIFDVDIFNLNDDNSLVDPDVNCLFKSIRCKYYILPHDLNSNLNLTNPPCRSCLYFIQISEARGAT